MERGGGETREEMKMGNVQEGSDEETKEEK